MIINNFRCYYNSTISFNGTSILVGKNNAGKSTLIEALKIISSVTRKYRTLRFVSAPLWVTNFDSYGVILNEIKKRTLDAFSRNINIHVWSKNEIDKYAININVINRYLESTSITGHINEKLFLRRLKKYSLLPLKK